MNYIQEAKAVHTIVTNVNNQKSFKYQQQCSLQACNNPQITSQKRKRKNMIYNKGQHLNFTSCLSQVCTSYNASKKNAGGRGFKPLLLTIQISLIISSLICSITQCLRCNPKRSMIRVGNSNSRCNPTRIQCWVDLHSRSLRRHHPT